MLKSPLASAAEANSLLMPFASSLVAANDFWSSTISEFDSLKAAISCLASKAIIAKGPNAF